MKKNGILTLLFALIPGAGEMYQGYMKRGLSLITMFCLSVALGAWMGIEIFYIGAPILYMYSFFRHLQSAGADRPGRCTGGRLPRPF